MKVDLILYDYMIPVFNRSLQCTDKFVLNFDAGDWTDCLACGASPLKKRECLREVVYRYKPRQLIRLAVFNMFLTTTRWKEIEIIDVNSSHEFYATDVIETVSKKYGGISGRFLREKLCSKHFYGHSSTYRRVTSFYLSLK